MIHMSQEATGKVWKLARAFHGRFQVLSVTPTNVGARLVDRPVHFLFPGVVHDTVTMNLLTYPGPVTLLNFVPKTLCLLNVYN